MASLFQCQISSCSLPHEKMVEGVQRNCKFQLKQFLVAFSGKDNSKNIKRQTSKTTKKLGAKMEENGKQHSTAIMMNVNENCMDMEVIRKQVVVFGDPLSYADEALITHYLNKKMIDQRFLNHTIHDVDFFLYHPQQLSHMHHPSQAKEWYFLSPARKKYTEGGQCTSSNNDGYWEPCGIDSLIHKDGKLIGYRKKLNYIEGKHAKDRKRTEWLMHEYRLDRRRDVRTGTTSDDMQWVFCKLFKSGDKFLEAEDKVATKFAGPTAGVSSMDYTIQSPEKAHDLTDDMGLSNGRSCDLHPLPETDEGITTPCSSSPHGSHENEAVVVPRYNGWPFNTAKRLPPFDGPFESLTEQEFAFFDKLGPEYSQAYENKIKRPRND